MKQILSIIIMLFAVNIMYAQQNNESRVKEDTDDYMVPLDFEKKETKENNTSQVDDNSSKNTDNSITDDLYEGEVVELQDIDYAPIFQGCEIHKTKHDQYKCFVKKIMEHVGHNFTYPEIAKEMNVQGRVVVQFIIDNNGNVVNSTVLIGVDRNLDKEALRIISLIPKMQSPAYKQGKAVALSFVMPITFKLE